MEPDFPATSFTKARLKVDLELSEGETSLRKEDTGLGHFSYGWLFSENLLFSLNQQFTLIHSIEVLGLKAVIKTDQGARGKGQGARDFNMQYAGWRGQHPGNG